MPATIQDVASRAGVSTATVSRVLRGLPNVSLAARDRVLRVAEELDYHITPQVSRMASGRRVIGIVAPLADQWYFSKLVTVAEIELIAHGYDVVRYSVDGVASQINLLRYLYGRKLVDGLILCSLDLSDETVDILTKSRLPVSTIEVSSPAFSSIGVDNVAAAAMATRYLINLGHRRIGIISGLEEAPLQVAIPEARKRGYLEALQQHQITFRAELERPGNYLYEGGAEAMKQLFLVHQPPTAVFAFSDEMAIGALKMVRDMHLRVPEDLSIIGFDDNDVAEYVGLTTVRQPVVDYSEVAVAQIIRQLENDDFAVEHVVQETELIIRSTTGPAPMAGR